MSFPPGLNDSTDCAAVGHTEGNLLVLPPTELKDFYHLPEGYTPGRVYPLMVMIHGSPGDENTVPPFFAAYSFTRVFASYRQQATDPVILVWPTRRPNENGWSDQYLRQVSTLIDKLVVDFSINTNRIYIGGASEGLHAAWDLVGMRSSLFAGGWGQAIDSPGPALEWNAAGTTFAPAGGIWDIYVGGGVQSDVRRGERIENHRSPFVTSDSE